MTPELRPDDPSLADAAASMAAAYVHIPFCARVCPYCDFNVVAGKDDLTERYVSVLVSEIRAEEPWRPLDAIYFGGGTPSRVPPQLLGRVVSTLRERFGVTQAAEVSIEANPEDWSPLLAEGLRAAGFTRVSFGAQSFDSDVLASLGRMHTPAQAEDAVQSAHAAGFSVNVDLIFGTPGEHLSDWETSVERALSLDLEHLSAYALTVELGTALSRSIKAGAAAPDEDLQADEYLLLADLAVKSGLVHYEISNFAAPGQACVYNLVTWAQGEYLAFGAGAHGHRDGERKRNVRRVDAYLERVEAGASPVHGTEHLGEWGREQERLLLGLRRVAGIEAGTGGRRLLASAAGKRLLDAGVLEEENGRIRILRPLMTDEASRAVLALS